MRRHSADRIEVPTHLTTNGRRTPHMHGHKGRSGMADDEIDEDEEDEALEEEDIDEDALDDDEEDLAEYDVDDDDEVLADDEVDEAETGEVSLEAAAEEETAASEDVEDDVVDLDEELHPDDVEEALDVVLRERTTAAGLEEDGDDEDEPDDRGEGGTKIVPRRPGEFLCSSCFLVLPRHQLADEKRMLCRDCA